MTARTRMVLLVVAAAAALAGAMIALSLVAGRGSGSEADVGATLPQAAEVSALLRGIPQDGLVLGRQGAPVTVVEYADLQCPFCAQWAADPFHRLVTRYVRSGDVRIEFRGLAFIGQDSRTALEAVLAAGEQDRLWNVLELLYANQGAENAGWVTDDLLRAVGRSVPGLDVDRMLADMGGGAVAGQIDAHAADAQAAGVRGTPAFAVGRTGGRLETVDTTQLDARLKALTGR